MMYRKLLVAAALVAVWAWIATAPIVAAKQIYSGEIESYNGQFVCNCTICTDHGCFCIGPG